MFFGTGLLLFLLLIPLGRLLGMRFGDRAVFALSGTFANGVGIGIPFITYAFGEAGLAQLYRTGVGLATNAVVISTGGSVLTLSVALLLLGVQGR